MYYLQVICSSLPLVVCLILHSYLKLRLFPYSVQGLSTCYSRLFNIVKWLFVAPFRLLVAILKIYCVSLIIPAKSRSGASLASSELAVPLDNVQPIGKRLLLAALIADLELNYSK